MSDNPTVQQAADVMDARLVQLGADEADVIEMAQALTDAGLLVGHEQAAVVELIDDIRWLGIYPEVAKLIAAVDRLAVPSEAS